jgi:putative FmdB family regulatory protein
MPLYEYACPDCKVHFDVLRSMADADASIRCPQCNEEGAHRVITVFSAIGSSGIIAGAGSSCGACGGGSCATCGSKSG